MSFCDECGAKLVENAVFCDDCGAKIEQSENVGEATLLKSGG